MAQARLEALIKSQDVTVVDVDEPWTVLQGKRIKANTLRAWLQTDDTVEDGLGSTTDEDDSFHTGQPVSLSEHNADVERLVRDYAAAAGLSHELIDDPAWQLGFRTSARPIDVSRSCCAAAARSPSSKDENTVGEVRHFPTCEVRPAPCEACRHPERESS